MSSSLRVVSKADFRPIKDIAAESAIQLEYNGNDVDSIIWCELIVRTAKDGGLLLILESSRAKDVGFFDKIEFGKEDDATGELPPKVFVIHVHNSNYTFYDFKKKDKLELTPSPLELAFIKWFTENPGYIANDNLLTFQGRLFFDSSDEDEIKRLVVGKVKEPDVFFRGNWVDTSMSGNSRLLDVYTEYMNTTGASGGNGKGNYTGKTLSQKFDERIKVAGALAWDLLYPGMEMPSNLDKKQVIDMVVQIKAEANLDILQLLLPSS